MRSSSALQTSLLLGVAFCSLSAAAPSESFQSRLKKRPEMPDFSEVYCEANLIVLDKNDQGNLGCVQSTGQRGTSDCGIFKVGMQKVQKEPGEDVFVVQNKSYSGRVLLYCILDSEDPYFRCDAGAPDGSLEWYSVNGKAAGVLRSSSNHNEQFKIEDEKTGWMLNSPDGPYTIACGSASRRGSDPAGSQNVEVGKERPSWSKAA